jgi:DNA replication and repair protein RecF
MFLQQLNLTNFRNYENVNLEFSDGINIFYGNNAQGKTNILEGIYFLALTKSHRTNNDNELLKDDKVNFSVTGILKKDDMSYKLKIQYIDKKKKYYIDNDEIKKNHDFLDICR